MDNTDHYEILGIHGEEVYSVDTNVARVRMFIGEKEIDEDFDLPELPPQVTPTTEIYSFFLKKDVEARMKELA